MYGLKGLLLEEEKRLKRIKTIVDERLTDVPQGTLRITTSNNKVQYVRCVENSDKSGGKLRYIRKDDLPMVRQLAQKNYDQKVKKIVDKRCGQFDRLIKEYEDDEIEEIYLGLHQIRRGLVNPVEETWEQRLALWKATPYNGKEFKEGQVEIYTKKGERVRSKSEKILADMFYDYGIEYKYECPLHLKGYGIVYPDFTFLSKKTYEEIYWEHDGRMGDPEYVEKAIRKIDQYIKNNIIPGRRLIVTYESSSYALNTSVAEQYIREYLL